MEPTENNIPKHVGIIIDGNRRFAKRLMLKPWKGHEWGAKKFEKLLEWSQEYKIKELTLYTFSIENFDRPQNEFNYLMKLFEKEAISLLKDKRLQENGIKINFIGRIHKFPRHIQGLMHEIMNLTKENSNYIVNMAMAYGGRAEIIDATKKISQQIKEGKLNIEDINEEVFNKNIYLESEPDLIIRTSESRLSGFLLWQSSYAEIIFLPEVLWPEFSKEHFTQCLEEYSKRKRRFGN
ncbi:MAG: di-trans,poly-cis-decaprenylcistransferase [Nanoarchaeota archaeon]|nr:di-trans,poly-cis-decaprenylcistransferase [Nanoarchaeota archaeon]|tara:strand:- start:550 stop:1260 length:711 start_codon:yes stop_codon:yes gene_type:complete